MANREPRQVRKGAAVAAMLGAEVWLARIPLTAAGSRQCFCPIPSFGWHGPPKQARFPLFAAHNIGHYSPKVINDNNNAEHRMSYLVLARKWRPKTFDDVVGQSHVVRALTNALSADRVHHAYLFAGTRGVGKTTLARILAKALNCREGVAVEPCGVCDACVALNEGRFVDLIEVDAASRTGVDDTRDLLENVQYTPSSGRYKVYLIDEVHMLSKQSFNALLKTLEEPPPHVKFLFATTDPQKLPITVLSRCLQFNLKRLSISEIDARMTQIMVAEDVTFAPAALTRIARAASGSMRDALSLLDQALAFGDGKLEDAEVAVMLGSMDRHRVIAVLDALVEGDVEALLARVRELDDDVPDYERLLDELATLLQRVALVQLAGPDALEDEEHRRDLERIAGSLEPAQTQLYYQIAITSRRDLGLAPDPRLGFEMSLLRMLAFRADVSTEAETQASPKTSLNKLTKRRVKTTSAKSPPSTTAQAKPATARTTGSGPKARAQAGRERSVPTQPEDWPQLVEALPVRGAARQLAENAALAEGTPFELRLRVESQNQHLVTEKLRSRLTQVVQEYLGTAIKLTFTVAEEVADTVAQRADQKREHSEELARKKIAEDPGVQELADLFGGEVVPESVRPSGEG